MDNEYFQLLVFFVFKVGIRIRVQEELGSRDTMVRAATGEGPRRTPGRSTRAQAMTMRRGTLSFIIN